MFPRIVKPFHSAIRRAAFHSSRLNLADPYKIIGVNKDATSSEIKKKYYQLAKEFHPDTNKDPKAKEKFVEIQNAYEILSDETKRRNYDQFGDESQQQQNPYGGFGGFQGGNPFGGSGNPFEDLLRGFGSGGTRGNPFAQNVGDDIGMNNFSRFIRLIKVAFNVNGSRTILIE